MREENCQVVEENGFSDIANSLQGQVVSGDCMTDVIERIQIMCSQEASSYSCVDYLQLVEVRLNLGSDSSSSGGSNSSFSTTSVDEQSRMKIAKWFYTVVDRLDIKREVAIVAMSCLDRFLAQESYVRERRNVYKIAAAAALSLAVKAHEPRKMRQFSSYFPHMTRNEFDSRHIHAMELLILRGIKWHLNPPTAADFVGHFVSFLREEENSSGVSCEILESVWEASIFTTELAVFSYFFVAKKPSRVGFAALANAIDDMEGIPQSVRDGFYASVATSFPDLTPLSDEIVDIRYRLHILKQGNLFQF